MGLFGSIARYLKTLFGLAEGQTERAADSLLTSSPEAIRNQFRKTKEDWVRDYEQMKNAVADLSAIRQGKFQELGELKQTLEQKTASMNGAVELYKKSQDERLREAYARLADEKETLEERSEALHADIENQDKLIQSYKDKLRSLQQSISNLKKEESETVAEIVSSRKIAELNAKLEGLSTDTQAKNLDAIREARKKARALAQLSNDLKQSPQHDLDLQIAQAGKVSKHLDVFDKAVHLDRVFVEPAEAKLLSKEKSVNLDALFP